MPAPPRHKSSSREKEDEEESSSTVSRQKRGARGLFGLIVVHVDPDHLAGVLPLRREVVEVRREVLHRVRGVGRGGGGAPRQGIRGPGVRVPPGGRGGGGGGVFRALEGPGVVVGPVGRGGAQVVAPVHLLGGGEAPIGVAVRGHSHHAVFVDRVVISVQGWRPPSLRFASRLVRLVGVVGGAPAVVPPPAAVVNEALLPTVKRLDARTRVQETKNYSLATKTRRNGAIFARETKLSCAS